MRIRRHRFLFLLSDQQSADKTEGNTRNTDNDGHIALGQGGGGVSTRNFGDIVFRGFRTAYLANSNIAMTFYIALCFSAGAIIIVIKDMLLVLAFIKEITELA